MEEKTKEITKVAKESFQGILDSLWSNENISRQDYVDFLAEIINACKHDIWQYPEDV